jgi:hypothetical protein
MDAGLGSFTMMKNLQKQQWEFVVKAATHHHFPMQTPAPLFEIIDNTLSKYWRFKLYPNGLLKIAFEQWFSDTYFYDKLTNQEEEEVLIFEKVKELMDAEAKAHPPMPVVLEDSLVTPNV